MDEEEQKPQGQTWTQAPGVTTTFSDRVPVGRAVQELTFNRNPANITGSWDRRLLTNPLAGHGFSDRGRLILHYTFALCPIVNDPNFVGAPQRLNIQQRNAVRRSMAEFERVYNIEFHNVGSNIQDADIAFSACRMRNGLATTDPRTGIRNVILNSVVQSNDFRGREAVNRACIHELGHAIGLHHPGAYGSRNPTAGGNNLNYRSATFMSYWNVLIAAGMRSYDVAAGQSLYGAPRERLRGGVGAASSWLQTYDRVSGNLLTSATLWNSSIVLSPWQRRRPVTLQLNNRYERGTFNIRLSGPHEGHYAPVIDGNFYSASGRPVQGVGLSLVPDHPGIRNVEVGPQSRVRIHITGDNQRNRMQAGLAGGSLRPRGGGDILSAGGGGMPPSTGFSAGTRTPPPTRLPSRGRTKFIFDRYSGLHNVITNYDPRLGNDLIHIDGLYYAELRARNDLRFEGQTYAGTEIRMRRGKGGGVVSSVMLLNVSPQEIRIIPIRGLVIRRMNPASPSAASQADSSALPADIHSAVASAGAAMAAAGITSPKAKLDSPKQEYRVQALPKVEKSKKALSV